MSAFIQVISDQQMAIMACGRACADMDAETLPLVPRPAPVSLAAILREYPESVIAPEWLAAMDTAPTVH